MDLTIPFHYKNKVYQASVFFSFDEEPCFIFVTLDNKELVKEFGEEITIKTDCRTVLPRKDDYPELKELRQSIFNSVKNTRAFELAKVQYENLVVAKSRKLY